MGTPTAVLVVEDERIIAKGIEKRLKTLGYAVVGMAATGENGVRMAADLRPDIVLMDINLGPGIDGIEAAARVRAGAGIPVVFLTAHSDDATLHRAKLTGPHGYVLKPFDDKDLYTAIEIGLYRHQMDRRLRENEEWLAATLASIGDGVIATDDRGRVRFLNTLAETLTGWPQADAAGRDVREVFRVRDEKTGADVPNPVFEALDRGVPVTLAPDAVLTDRAGRERSVDDTAAPIRDVSGAVCGAVLVFRDITERRRLEEHLRQAQKMEAVGRLAGGIAHDFNNIMTVVTGFAELLLAETPPDDPRQAYARAVQEAGTRAAGLTRQIMAFSRKQLLVPAVLNLNAVARDMAAVLRRLVGEHIALDTRLAPDLGAVKADPTQVGQVLLNLAANARDAMPGGGRLEVTTGNADLGPDVTRDHPDVTPGRYVEMAVSDSGCGMTDEVRRQAFEPFFTTKPVGKGTGLGLATVYGIVKQSGGHVAVASAPGAGTTVRVYLPRVADPVPAPAPPLAPAGGRETVLLVEDEELIRRMTRTVLERTGYEVLEAAGGAEAVARAAAHPGPIHLLLTDVVMPGFGGRELAARVTAARPDTRVVFMSGYTEDDVLLDGVGAATADFVRKPFTVAGLTRKLREVLDRA